MVINDYISFVNSSLTKNQINKPVFIWLLILTIMTFLMILIGGLTRLTESGLSMVDWKPILGTIPPLNKKNWIDAFTSYQKSPEFIIVNKNITLDEFKYIFWWEWFHRFFARCIGIVFILPMLFFFIKKKIKKTLLYSLLILFLFGLFQAIIGWWMVTSGLNDNPYVSPYRLAFHLTNAVIILTVLFWLTLNSYNNIAVNFFPNVEGNLGIAFLVRPFDFTNYLFLTYIVIISVFGTIGILCLIMAYRIGLPAANAPCEYIFLIYALLIGYFLFNEIPDILSLFGMSLIILSGIYIFIREGIKKSEIAIETRLR